MSGIIPPSILSYEIPFVRSSDKFITVSFPFRVRIEKIWFTGTSALVSDVNVWTNERTMKLAAYKHKNPLNPVDSYDRPSDENAFFGIAADSKPYTIQPDENLKPTMFLGNPDNRVEGQQVQIVSIGYNQVAHRSSASSAPLFDSPNNGVWANQAWTNAEWDARAYKTDLAIMNVDEMLSLFVYDSGGDWSTYTDGSAMISIYIAYSGMSQEDEISAPQYLWTDWIND